MINKAYDHKLIANAFQPTQSGACVYVCACMHAYEHWSV